MLTGHAFEATVMILSFIVFCGAYLLFVWRDKSWINLATPMFIGAAGAKYIFQFGYLVLFKPAGSHYAYLYCYATYAFSFLAMALVYCFAKPIGIKVPSRHAETIGKMPWLLLGIGFLLYAPILVEFRQYLTDTRRIYELTRTGYGIWFYSSTMFATIGFVLFLFKNKSFLSNTCFYLLCAALGYLHGTKGPLITYSLIWMLYFVYVKRKRIRFLVGAMLMLLATLLVISTFALFGSAADTVELLTGVVNYADYVRNAMVVIDDTQGKRFYGKLTLEGEFYPRIPRAIMPDKPKDFGSFRIAKIYDPANFREDQGTSAYDIGVQYADFGPFTIVLLCIWSAINGWLALETKAYLQRSNTPGPFLVLLFIAGVGVVPISGVFVLPETLLLAAGLSLALRFNLLRGCLRLQSPPNI